MGRPATGKRSNPDWKQASIYLREETLRKAKHWALDHQRDLSDVVENLLHDLVAGKLYLKVEPQPNQEALMMLGDKVYPIKVTAFDWEP